MAKSAEAFRTISEASSELDVPQHVLRHWEDAFGQIRPMRRAGGRRYYRPHDIDLLRGVRVLLYDERYTTKGVQKIFRKNGAKYIAEIGRRSAAGEDLDLSPDLDDDRSMGSEAEIGGPPSSDGDGKGAPVSTMPDPRPMDELLLDGSMTPGLRRKLEKILTRLEKVQDALDEASLAIEAIDFDGDARS